MTGPFIAFVRKFWKPLVLIILVALSLWRFGHWRYSAGQTAERLLWSDKWSKRDKADAEARAQREASERAEEQRRQQAANEEEKRADEELAKVQADVDAAQRASDGLQRQLATFQRQLAGSETGRLSALAAAGAAKAEAARVLTQLLGESDKAAGIYAAEADRAYIAGQTCERIYNKVTRQEWQNK